jgi:excinuclease ABC subunit A
VVIEHNLDVIKTADWVIDLGPEAGDEGGFLVAAGTPEDIVAHAVQHRASATPKKRTAKTASARPKKPAKVEAKLLRSYTGESLEPVLAAGPYAKRAIYDFAAAEAARKGDRDIAEVGETTKMPWELDGRNWHTVARVGRTGHPCRWDGRILDDVIERIEQQSDLFSPTDWNSRTVVEICAAKKSDGWFFHAITGEEWLLKMKFRTARNTFQRDDLVATLGLKPLNDMPELPLYGAEPRVRVRGLRGPWQEIELRVHGYAEIDRPEFWKFVDRAVAGFGRFSERVQQHSEILQPWKQLGRKWHFARKGFPIGKKVLWETEVLEELMELLAEVAPQGQLLWNNKQVVPMYVAPQKEPWAAVQTKKLDAVYLMLAGPKGCITQGRLAGVGHEAQWDGQRPDCDLLRIKFRSLDDLHRGDLRGLLKEHLATLKKE